jgi:hypothetical protein
MMIHNVYFWLKEGISDDDRKAFEEGLRGLFAVEEIDEGSFGKPAATPERPVTDHSFSYSLSLKFKSVEDHNIYQDHPEHHRFVENCQQYWQRAQVYDSEVID